MGMSNQTEEKELFHAVSLSGGKDSTAMLLLRSSLWLLVILDKR